jgi:hypothetical protein
VSIRSSDVDGPGVDTLGILVNVIWIIEHMDGRGLAEIGDLPILELAKHITIERAA